MQFEQEGEPFLKIIDPLHKTKKNNYKTLYITDKNVSNSFNEFWDDTKIIQPIPLPDRERFVSYITAKSGAGKSYYASKLTEEYHKFNPKNAVYLFSPFEQDGKSFNFKWITKIDIKHNDFVTEDWNVEDFTDSLLILDDIESITNKKVKNILNDILNLVLEAGRKQRISCIYTSHLTMQGHGTRRILNEMHSLTLFPRSVGERTLKYILDTNYGMSKDQIERIKKLKSRWVTIVQSYPMVVVHENGAYIPN